MDSIAEQLEFPIDFKGQEKAESIVKIGNYLAIVTSFFLGLIAQDITVLVYSFLAISLIILLLVLPSWPIYKKNPVKWLKVQYEL